MHYKELMSKPRGFKSLIYNTSINLENKLFDLLQVLNQKDMQVHNVFLDIDENIAQCQILKNYAVSFLLPKLFGLCF